MVRGINPTCDVLRLTVPPLEDLYFGLQGMQLSGRASLRSLEEALQRCDTGGVESG